MSEQLKMSADKFIKQRSAPVDPFDPEKYIDAFYSNVAWHNDAEDSMKFFQDCLLEAFKEDLNDFRHRLFGQKPPNPVYHNHLQMFEGNITGTTLLDVGTGPIPNMAFCAAPWFQEITLSDFSPNNREFLRKWKDGEINHMGPVFEYIMRLDKSGSMEERQDLLRKKVRNIVFCDITQPNPTASTVVDGVTFDAITCSNCLEVASFTLDDYAKSVRNICTLLKPGGYFVLEGCLEISFYRLGDKLYECYPIKKNDLQDIVQKAGLEIISMKVLNYTPRPEEYYYTDCESVFAIVARKL